MIRSALLSMALCAWLAVPDAHAAGGVYCDGATDKSVGAYLTVGRVPGFAVVGARITANDQDWDLLGREGAAPITLAQGAVVGDLTVADFSDPGAERIVASLRVVRVENDIDVAAAGVLSIPGVGVWPVICEIE